MRSIVLALATAAVVVSAPAMAADMRMPVKAAPMAAPIFTWTGFYIGGFVGGATGDRNARSTEPCTVVGASCFGLFTVAGVTTPNDYSLGSSFIGGGTVGYNWQAPGSQWVFGLEGEAGYLHLQRSVRDINAPPPGLSPGGFDSTRIGDVYGVIAGRLGIAVDRLLFYGKGGVAFVEKNHNYASTVGVTSASLNNSHLQTTWAAGAGLEWAFAGNWSLKGEYLYIATRETYNTTGLCTGGFCAPVATFTSIHSDPGVHTGKLGLNYRF
ncbi:porin family protein [Bradyrhizobium sp. AUGA SZCCT0169]|uniref:outer membrane protein n=1 Tax=unclassified Bradyrhizobium TaxID=2631580 RepID=UPI001BAB47AB|nr:MULTISPECIES: outer membrane beta-barrel protein [unclassified Bradyrhizobium]MBR1192683.1 porin family protein [Bradyrhizobium sp. AUGA SZCCT0160]MBR1252035.1 porin family protein [Bradyrhizobium sp. AUGA SZCCT0169]